MNKSKGMKVLKRLVVLCMVLSMTITGSMVSAAGKSDVTKTFKDKKKVTNLVDSMSSRLGYELLYSKEEFNHQKIKLDDRFMLETAGMSLYEPTAKKLHKITMNLFGRRPSVKKLKVFQSQEAFYDSEVLAGRLKDGTLLAMQGDWGLAAPITKVKKITKTGKGTYKLNTEIVFHDFEDETEKPLGKIAFSVKQNKNSEYGYVITAIVVDRIK